MDQDPLPSVERRHALMELAAELSPAGMLAVDRSGKIVLVNREIERMFGYRREELLGEPIEKLIPERLRSAHPNLRAQYFETPDTRPMGIGRDLHGVRKDGSEVPVEIGLNPIQSTDGFYVLSSIVDITARREAETRLRQSQKMEAIGTLASGIAHDFNNILLSIIGHTELVTRQTRLDTQAGDDLKNVLIAAARGRELIQRILTFSRQQDLIRKPISPAPAIREALRLLRASLPATIEMRDSIDESTPQIQSEATLIHQVLMNLASNAAFAMREEGVIEIKLKPVHLVDHATLSPGSYCELTVHDTGPGMTDTVVQRIFEPFFTTKGPGQGTGLGLSVVLGIVEAHGGHIAVETGASKGTTFRILLPTLAEDANRGVSGQDLPHALIVEDEPTLGMMTARSMELLGYRTTLHSSSLDALEAFRADPSWFDLVITDNTMPRLTGMELATRIRALRTDIPILLVSGRGEKTSTDPDVITRFLSKPYTLSELEEMLVTLRALQQRPVTQ